MFKTFGGQMLPRVAWGEGDRFLAQGKRLVGKRCHKWLGVRGLILAQGKCEDALNDLKPFPPLFSVIYALASFL